MSMTKCILIHNETNTKQKQNETKKQSKQNQTLK